ncbi:kelch domain-containing protein 3-like isoform X2 [Anoplophora glabripennis]|uniref:kelch domain-containing protein 3-like isoform X2 n=1 Tax=Anoplophora glabripennis TaxID=217634 RepID=UPI000873E6AF|nr:kelch domain-containing protein 3-like isoform X2 [Anoplophora glabripennis]
MRWISNLEGGPKRVNHAAVSVGHKIYSFGGYCTGENSREYASMDVHVLNTTTFRWTKHPVSDLPYFENDDILPFKRYGHTAVVHGDKIYIWGGRNDRATCSTLFCFDTVWHCWTAPKTTGNIPLARDGHTACMWKNCMFIFGGYEEESDAFARSVYCLNLDKMTWSIVHTSGMEPSLRDFHTTVCIKDRMYLFGGRGTIFPNHYTLTGAQETYSNQLWYLDFKTFTWHACMVTGDIPVGRRSHSAFVYNDKMYIFGGYNSVKDQHYNDMYEFNPDTNAWKRLNCRGKGPSERRRQACIPVGDRIFLFGGTSPQQQSKVGSNHGEEMDDILMDHSDMYVLDFQPTLKTLCIIAVRQYKLDESVLPTNVKLDIMNMFTPNKITINRPNNSAG